MAKVAFLGLGVMGYPMAAHLKNKGGHELTVYNRTTDKAAKWVAQHGGKSAATPAEAAVGQDFVFACVGNDDDLRAVTLGPDGAFAAMQKGAVFVDSTTASAEVARELAASEEFEREQWELDTVLGQLIELAELAQLAESQGQALFVWMRLDQS